MKNKSINFGLIDKQISIIILVVLFMACLSSPTYSQDKDVSVINHESEDKIIIRHNLPEFVPLKVEMTGLNSEDILRDFEVKITNTGEIPIYSLRYSLRTVDVTISGAPLANTFEYGRHDLSGGANESEKNNIKPTDIPINRNESVTFKLSEAAVKVRKRNSEIGLYPKPRIYELVLVDLTYADRSGFTKRGFFKAKKNFK